MAAKKRAALAWEHLDGLFPTIADFNGVDFTAAAFFHPEERRPWLVVQREFEGTGVYRLGEGGFELVLDGARLGLNQDARDEETLLAVCAYYDSTRKAPALAATRGSKQAWWLGHVEGNAFRASEATPPKVSWSSTYTSNLFAYDTTRGTLLAIAWDLALWELHGDGWRRAGSVPLDGSTRDLVLGFDEVAGRAVVVHLATCATVAWDGAQWSTLGATPRPVTFSVGASAVHERQHVLTVSDPANRRFLLYVPGYRSEREYGAELWALAGGNWSVETPGRIPQAAGALYFDPTRREVCALLATEPDPPRVPRREARLEDGRFDYRGPAMGPVRCLISSGHELVASGYEWAARWAGKRAGTTGALEPLRGGAVPETMLGWGRHRDDVVGLGSDGYVYRVEGETIVRASIKRIAEGPRQSLSSAYDPEGRTLFVKGTEVWSWDGATLTRATTAKPAPSEHHNTMAWHPGLRALVATRLDEGEVWTLKDGAWGVHKAVFGKKKWAGNPRAKLLAWDDKTATMLLVLGMIWESKVPEWAILVMDDVTSFRKIAVLRHNRVERTVGLGADAVELTWDPLARELVGVGSPHDGAANVGVMRLALGPLLDSGLARPG